MQGKPTPAVVAEAITNTINSPLVAGHTCNIKRCTVKPLSVELHHLNGEYHIVHRYIKPKAGLSKATFIENVYSIYVCSETGKIHHCHAACDGFRQLNNSMNVCQISGEQFDGESVMSWQLSSRCRGTEQFKKGDPLKYSRKKDGTVINSAHYNISQREYKNIAHDVIKTLLFSEKRWKHENDKAHETRRIIEKQVQKYLRACRKRKKTPVYTVLLNDFYATMNRRNMNSSQVIQKTSAEEEAIVEKLTLEVYTYWELVMNMTVKKTPSTHFQFKAFVSAVLYLMKNGVKMRSKNGEDLYIIRRDTFLDRALPESNKLDMYEISKPLFTSTKNAITKSIRDTVERKIKSVAELRNYVQKKL